VKRWLEALKPPQKDSGDWESFLPLLAHALRHKKGIGALQRRIFTGGALYEKIRL
jgi:hypothetical protein